MKLLVSFSDLVSLGMTKYKGVQLRSQQLYWVREKTSASLNSMLT